MYATIVIQGDYLTTCEQKIEFESKKILHTFSSVKDETDFKALTIFWLLQSMFVMN